jgi:exosortase
MAAANVLAQRLTLPHAFAGAVALFAAALLFTYWNVGAALVAQWSEDENYSHGFGVVPLAAYFAWTRRGALSGLPSRPSYLGLIVVALSLTALAAGIAAAELFLARASLIGVLGGAILFTYGVGHLRLLALPLGFLCLMIPPPEIVFNQIALPLQLFASRVGEVALREAGVAVLRDGNVLELASMRLEVAQACSGIRSIVSLLTFAIVLGELGKCSWRRMLLLAFATVPIAVVANATRVAVTGLAAHIWGREVAEGLLHSTSGVVVFGAAVSALLLVERTIIRMRAPHVQVVAT